MNVFVLVFILILIKNCGTSNISRLEIIDLNNLEGINKAYKKEYKCFFPSDDSNSKIIHFIITRFILEFDYLLKFRKIIYKKEYILNGIRCLKKYLLPSLEYQSCKKFIWILEIGDKANIEKLKPLLNFNVSFKYKIIFHKHLKKYIRNKSKYFDILITSRIDYDDIIYFDAVNDVRKAINNNKPMVLYGYNRGVYHFENDTKFYEFYQTYNNEGTMSIFNSLITVLKKVNDCYTINDIGGHSVIRKNLIKSYKSFGIEKLNYEPAIFDSGEAKFIYIRQNFSGTYNNRKEFKKSLKIYNFNLTKFFGINFN